MKKLKFILTLLFLLFVGSEANAAVPLMFNYQGTVTDASNVPVDGNGYFKFAIVDSTGIVAYWANDGTTLNGSEPMTAVTVPVSNGHFAIKIGDTALTNMAALSQSVFDNTPIYMRVWFSYDGLNFEQFSPDAQLISNAFALKAGIADQVENDAINTDAIVDSTITNADISASAAISATKIDTTGLDADSLDGMDSVDFATSSHNHDASYSLITHNHNGVYALLSHGHNYAGSTTDGGAASNAELLDGIDSSGFATSSHAHPNDGDWTVSGNNIYSTVSGNVGIGTTSPTDKLTVNGTASVSGFTDIGGNLDVGGGRINFGSAEYIEDGGTNLVSVGFHSLYVGGILGLAVEPNSQSYRLALPNSAGTLGQGIANGWQVYSSKRWKENINTIENALDKVQRLRGVTFNWKDSGKHDIGLVAEEVGAVIPEVVHYESNGVDASALDYSRLVSVLIEAVKEQQITIESLQKRIDAIENANSSVLSQ